MWPIPQYIRSVKHISTSTVRHIQTKTGKGPKFTNDLACTCILLPWRLYVSYSLPKIWLTCSILWIKCHIINIHNGFVIIISTPKTTYFSSHKKKRTSKTYFLVYQHFRILNPGTMHCWDTQASQTTTYVQLLNIKTKGPDEWLAMMLWNP